MTIEQAEVISVICPPDKRIHLAPTQKGVGASVFTLCLERWTRKEFFREDSEFCLECLKKLKERIDS